MELLWPYKISKNPFLSLKVSYVRMYIFCFFLFFFPSISLLSIILFLILSSFPSLISSLFLHSYQISDLMEFLLFCKFSPFLSEDCVHNILCGDGALKWAASQGFEECNGNGIDGKKIVLTEKSKKEWETWMEEKKGGQNVYKKVEKKVEKDKVKKGVTEGVKEGVNAVEIEGVKEVEKEVVDDDSHDTVGLICLDDKGRLACGTSTSG